MIKDRPNLTTFLYVLAVFATFFFVQYLDNQDNRAEWQESSGLSAQQIEEAAEASREFVGKEKCGPGARHEWKDNDLYCHPKRGRTYAAQ